jgi:hypothetical protein
MKKLFDKKAKKPVSICQIVKETLLNLSGRNKISDEATRKQ